MHKYQQGKKMIRQTFFFRLLFHLFNTNISQIINTVAHKYLNLKKQFNNSKSKYAVIDYIRALNERKPN